MRKKKKRYDHEDTSKEREICREEKFQSETRDSMKRKKRDGTNATRKAEKRSKRRKTAVVHGCCRTH